LGSDAASTATPLAPLVRLGRELGVCLWAKRDDLFAATGGGNKSRKMGPILAEAERSGCNALVTTGGLQSNHARATALEAAGRGWPCALVLHGDVGRAVPPTGNLLLCSLAGARIRVVDPTGVASGMSAAMQEFRDQGYTPWEIPGGGHCLAGGMAYADATSELAEQCRRASWWPDCVVVASGTGTTQAGLVAGFQRLGVGTKVVGISVARPNPRGISVVGAAYAELCAALAIAGRQESIDVRDEWVGEGYERPTEGALAAIRTAAAREGLILDPTYTGKAFGALIDLAKQGKFAATPNVLFWHTGGLLNLVTSDRLREALDRP
jgi:1-aminocyclopropane-1-carboxylate deaminase/D-cysteine desulfhydrase-like pyridoxal-dependent ACC family enzyme